jgi:hypothetical protein
MAYTYRNKVTISADTITPIDGFYFYPLDITFLMNQRKTVGNVDLNPTGFLVFKGSAAITDANNNPGVCKTGPVLVAFHEDQNGAKQLFDAPNDIIVIACPPWTKKGGIYFENLVPC